MSEAEKKNVNPFLLAQTSVERKNFLALLLEKQKGTEKPIQTTARGSQAGIGENQKKEEKYQENIFTSASTSSNAVLKKQGEFSLTSSGVNKKLCAKQKDQPQLNQTDDRAGELVHPQNQVIDAGAKNQNAAAKDQQKDKSNPQHKEKSSNVEEGEERGENVSKLRIIQEISDRSPQPIDSLANKGDPKLTRQGQGVILLEKKQQIIAQQQKKNLQKPKNNNENSNQQATHLVQKEKGQTVSQQIRIKKQNQVAPKAVQSQQKKEQGRGNVIESQMLDNKVAERTNIQKRQQNSVIKNKVQEIKIVENFRQEEQNDHTIDQIRQRNKISMTIKQLNQKKENQEKQIQRVEKEGHLMKRTVEQTKSKLQFLKDAFPDNVHEILIVENKLQQEMIKYTAKQANIALQWSVYKKIQDEINILDHRVHELGNVIEEQRKKLRRIRQYHKMNERLKMNDSEYTKQVQQLLHAVRESKKSSQKRIDYSTEVYQYFKQKLNELSQKRENQIKTLVKDRQQLIQDYNIHLPQVDEKQYEWIYFMQIDSFVEFLQGHWKNKCFSNARPIEYLKGIITTAYVQQKEREMINEVEDFLRLMKAKMDYQAQKMERVYLANIHEQTMEASANSQQIMQKQIPQQLSKQELIELKQYLYNQVQQGLSSQPVQTVETEVLMLRKEQHEQESIIEQQPQVKQKEEHRPSDEGYLDQQTWEKQVQNGSLANQPVPCIQNSLSDNTVPAMPFYLDRIISLYKSNSIGRIQFDQLWESQHILDRLKMCCQLGTVQAAEIEQHDFDIERYRSLVYRQARRRTVHEPPEGQQAQKEEFELTQLEAKLNFEAIRNGNYPFEMICKTLQELLYGEMQRENDNLRREIQSQTERNELVRHKRDEYLQQVQQLSQRHAELEDKLKELISRQSRQPVAELKVQEDNIVNFQMVQDSLDNYTRDEQVDQLKREFLELEVEETKARAYNVDLKNKINQAVKRWLKEEEESKEVYLGKLSDFRRKTKKDELDALEQRKAQLDQEYRRIKSQRKRSNEAKNGSNILYYNSFMSQIRE